MDPLDEAVSGLISGDPQKEQLSETSSSHDEPLDQALLDMMPIFPDF
jgi:hypothetical protein